MAAAPAVNSMVENKAVTPTVDVASGAPAVAANPLPNIAKLEG